MTSRADEPLVAGLKPHTATGGDREVPTARRSNPHRCAPTICETSAGAQPNRRGLLLHPSAFLTVGVGKPTPIGLVASSIGPRDTGAVGGRSLQSSVVAFVASVWFVVHVPHADSCPTRAVATSRKPSPAEASTAKELFAKGTKLRDANKHDAACKIFESSLHLDPQLGTRMNVAMCRERTGQLADAYALFSIIAEDAERTDDPRGSFITDRLRALESKLGRVRVKVTDPDRAGLTIAVDACPVDRKDLARPQVVAPGPIVVTAEAPERQPFHTVVDAVAGSEVAVEIPALQVDPDAQALRKAKEAELTTAKERRLAEQAATDREYARRYDRHPTRKWALAAAGLGAAAAITGGIFGIRAQRAQDQFVDDGCGERDQLLPAAAFASCRDLRDTGKRDALLSNALMIGGAGVIAVSIAVYVLDPGNVERPRTALALTPRSVGVIVRW